MPRTAAVVLLGALLAASVLAPASSDSLLPPSFGKRCTVANQDIECYPLVCNEGRCGFCKNTPQCQLSKKKDVCVGNGDRDPLAGRNMCTHKPLFPFDRNELASTLLTLIVGSLAAAGGIGGGGAVVPILILIDSFQAKHAVPISKAFLFGASLANAVVLWKRKHPTADRPLIDFPTVVLFVPTQIIGTQIGVTLNKVFPNWLIVLGLVLTLAYMTVRTAKKGMDVHRQEERAALEPSESRPILYDDQESPQEVSSELSAVLLRESKVPWPGLFLLFCLWAFIIIIALFKGGEGESIIGVACGGVTYWILWVIPFPIFAGVLVYLCSRTRRTHTQKALLNYPFQTGDIMWTRENVVLYPLLCTAAGFGSGCFGIGGGTITGPLMLALDMHPQVVAATASFMILFTSSLTTTQFLIVGALNLEYGAWFCFLGLCAGVIGQWGIAWALRRWRKQSVIILVMALVLTVGGFGLGINGIIQVVDDAKQGKSLGFRDLCAP